MMAADFVKLLQRVRARGEGRWMALCPAHQDRQPSLSIRQGADGRILLYDFGGCTPVEIVAAMGLRLVDLFVGPPRIAKPETIAKRTRVDRSALALQFELAALGRRLRADRVLQLARSLDTSRWHDNDFARALWAVERAHADLSFAQVLEYVADSLRWEFWLNEREVTNAARS